MNVTATIEKMAIRARMSAYSANPCPVCPRKNQRFGLSFTVAFTSAACVKSTRRECRPRHIALAIGKRYSPAYLLSH